MDPKSTTIMITGATSGIGKVTTLQLFAKGYNVCFCGRSQEKLDLLLQTIKNVDSKQYLARAFDLLKENECIQFIRDAEAKFGKINVLINNAGANTGRGRVDQIKTEDLEYMFKLNTVVPMIFMREVSHAMSARKNGLIINILSTACLYANDFIGSYTASKVAFEALTKIMRKEVRPNHVRVCGIYPGGTNTPFRANLREDYLAPEAVSSAIISVIEADPETCLDEIVLRPFVETNY
jgi:NADP-dependent 3-hydroxy acid dehydrogenase YdfG